MYAVVMLLFFLLRAGAQIPQSPAADAVPSVGVNVSYRLPADGPLPKTYRVTIAAVDPKDPNWIVSTFASGVVRTVTAENQGRFTETWNGLDDNYMPVPPGTYALKGIYMPAQTWPIDGQYHTITPKLVSIGASWGQTPSQDMLPNKIEGDPVDAPLGAVDVAPNGEGVVYFEYLENGTNGFLTDFTKPVGYDQIITGYPSGGVGGGSSACTDGKQIWLLCDIGHQFILHADGTPFGTGSAPGRDKVYWPQGWVKGLAAWPDPVSGHSVVFVAESGKILSPVDPSQRRITGAQNWRYTESGTDRVDQIIALDDGNKAAVLATWKVGNPLSVKARAGKLYVLHGANGKFEVLSLPLDANWKQARFAPVFTVPAGITPFDLEADSHGRIYLSDSAPNHIYQFDARGNKLRTYGRLDKQKGGAYDPDSFMNPEKLACWTDAQGKDRVLVVEQAGPNRLSEWSGDDGTMIRQWVTPQTRSNMGYAVDPRHPTDIYMPGQRDTLVRWKIDYATGQWQTDAVWFDVGTAMKGQGIFGGLLAQGTGLPRIIYHGEDRYLAFSKGYVIYHDEGGHWRPCTAIFRQSTGARPGQFRYYLWRDLNGDGRVQENEYLPFEIASPPPGLLRYFGDAWFDDLSLVCIGANTPDVWKLSPTGFDRNGTPLYDPNGFQKLLTDNISVDKKAGTATAIRGGNEIADRGFDCAWAWAAGALGGDIYVNARTGYSFSANYGAQFKLSRYVPDGKGGYTQKWRVGRIALLGNAPPGVMYGGIFVCSPINGLVGLVDTARAGFALYTDDGLYVDTLFPDCRVMPHDAMGSYWQPGEDPNGYDYVNKDDGKIYLALGKVMPKIYETAGWTTTQNPVQPLTTLDREATIAANQIASPPELALQIRGGAAAARVARFYPATGGGPALDGSITGWVACDPITFSSGPGQTIEARCFYDPDHLYIRWQVRLGHSFTPRALDQPQHIFAHDRGNDTLGLYLQGDPNAAPGGARPLGRPGDVRFVFGLFKDGDAVKPVVVGMYPAWSGAGASPVTYTTPVGIATFAHAGVVPDVNAGCKIDADGKGFSMSVAIPRAAIPGSPNLTGWHTQGNFDANLGGVDRFWWSNADGSASRDTFDEPTEARLFPGSWSPVQFMPVSPLSISSWMAIGPFGFPGITSLDARKGAVQIINTLNSSTFPPDSVRDMSASYDGDQTVTRQCQHKLAWKDIELGTPMMKLQNALGWDDLVRLPTGSYFQDQGTIYLLTHIYTPDPVAVTIREITIPHGLIIVSGQLNGVPLPTVPGPQNRYKTMLDDSKTVSLRAGWNELLIRSNVISADSDIGAAVVADPVLLWKLKISGPIPSGQ